MTKRSSEFRVGQCLRLKKHVNAGMAGAVALAHEQMYGKAAPPRQPEYLYLRVTKVEKERNPTSSDGNYAALFGVDLVRLTERAFRMNRTGKWVEFDPTPKRKMLDFWGYDEVVVLQKNQVRALIRD